MRISYICSGLWRLFGPQFILWGLAYNKILKLGHDALFNSLAVKARNRSHCPILVSQGIAHFYGPKKYSKPEEMYSLANPFCWECGWKISGDSWLEIKFLCLEGIFAWHTPKSSKCGKTCAFERSRMVTWPSCLIAPTLSLAWDLELEGPQIYDAWSSNIYFIKFNCENEKKMFGNPAKRVTTVGTGKWIDFYTFVKVGYYPLLPLACASIEASLKLIHWLLLCVVYGYTLTWPEFNSIKFYFYFFLFFIFWH